MHSDIQNILHSHLKICAEGKLLILSAFVLYFLCCGRRHLNFYIRVFVFFLSFLLRAIHHYSWAAHFFFYIFLISVLHVNVHNVCCGKFTMHMYNACITCFANWMAHESKVSFESRFSRYFRNLMPSFYSDCCCVVCICFLHCVPPAFVLSTCSRDTFFMRIKILPHAKLSENDIQ